LNFLGGVPRRSGFARAHWLEMSLQMPDAAPWSRRSTRAEVDSWLS
jgi:hypothetical protein